VETYSKSTATKRKMYNTIVEGTKMGGGVEVKKYRINEGGKEDI
jgi:hypothetical protein